MDAYSAPVDIMNRAAQHLNLPRIASPTDGSRVANEMSYAYDKIRQAELRRNTWRFATRRQQVRPLDWTTMLVKPRLWNVGTSYLAGAIVSYPLGNFWISRLPNAGKPPSNTTVDNYGNLVWDSYFGPLTAQSWNHQVPGQPEPDPNNGYVAAYDSGELAYVPIGNGTAAVFQCVQATSLGPLDAEGWLDAHYYSKGQIVSWPDASTFILGPNGDTLSDSSGLGNVLYQSLSNLNVGNDPQLTQLSGGAPAYNPLTAYVPSQYAYGSDNQIYLCTANTTGNDPVTDYANAYWQPQYMFMGMWQAFPGPAQALSIHWQQVDCGLVPITLAWPRGSRSWPSGTGPSSDLGTSNIYRLPANWLKRAVENPKDNLSPYLGGPSFITYKDWVFEGDWMISRLAGPVLFRFIADVQDVTEFDPMFAEALALQLAMNCGSACGAEVQSIAECRALYRETVEYAILIDAIEQGMVTEPDDLLITVRM